MPVWHRWTEDASATWKNRRIPVQHGGTEVDITTWKNRGRQWNIEEQRLADNGTNGRTEANIAWSNRGRQRNMKTQRKPVQHRRSKAEREKWRNQVNKYPWHI